MNNPEALRRRREAGLMVVTACEEALGVAGPGGLARLTGRSKSWWSKLASGTAAFPTWAGLERLLPPALTAAERESLHHRYRIAWLGLYEPELVERLVSRVPARPSLAELETLLNAAMTLGYVQGDHQAALRLQTILETLLVARGAETLSRHELDMLRDCLHQQCLCEGEFQNFDRSMAAARRSVGYQRRGGNRLGELSAQHLVGMALQTAGLHCRHDCLGKAVSQFEALLRDYERLGLTHEVIRARRDKAITKLDMGRREEGEAELLHAYEVRPQSGEDQFLTGIWLAEVALERREGLQARRWLAKLRVLTRRYPDEIARLLVVQYVARRVANLERAVADPPPPRRA